MSFFSLPNFQLLFSTVCVFIKNSKRGTSTYVNRGSGIPLKFTSKAHVFYCGASLYSNFK